MDPRVAITREGAHLTEALSGRPSPSAAALGAGPQQLRGDLNTLGTLFESAVVRDLIDAIITLPDGRWGAVEVKLGGQQLAVGATSLQAVTAQVDIAAIGEPAFRLVVTGTGPVLATDDGTVTAPLSALGP